MATTAEPGATGSGTSGGTDLHPLDPLTADEISRVATTLREKKGIDNRWRFASIELVRAG